MMYMSLAGFVALQRALRSTAGAEHATIVTTTNATKSQHNMILAPQLILQAGFSTTLSCGLRALPFLLIKLPLGFIYERLFLARAKRSPFVQQASWFEDIVIRCVRYAFAYIPANIGRVFFSRPVSLPFLRFRMMRHGYMHSPIHWHEVNQRDFNGVWIIHDKHQEPDIVIYYAHGGGFSMGSSYFYLEFLLAFVTLLRESGFHNPAILALEYTLVPDASYPLQIHQALAGYNYILSIVRDSSKVCLSGDSAGGTIVLSLLLHLANARKAKERLPINGIDTRRPGMAALISPWVTLVSSMDKNTSSDYLDAESLHLYARQYAGAKISASDALISPGNCKDQELWRLASPSRGLFIIFGKEEVFAPETRALVEFVKEAGLIIEVQEEKGGIHAWPVAALFLSSSKEKRQKGLKTIVKHIRAELG